MQVLYLGIYLEQKKYLDGDIVSHQLKEYMCIKSYERGMKRISNPANSVYWNIVDFKPKQQHLNSGGEMSTVCKECGILLLPNHTECFPFCQSMCEKCSQLFVCRTYCSKKPQPNITENDYMTDYISDDLNKAI